jgi:hypothetical protein
VDNVDNLVIEHLKRFQAGQDRIERKLEEGDSTSFQFGGWTGIDYSAYWPLGFG